MEFSVSKFGEMTEMNYKLKDFFSKKKQFDLRNKTSLIEVLILFDNVSSDSAPIIKSKIYSKINQ